jgi:membrane protease YdiL (CAAX protease family)
VAGEIVRSIMWIGHLRLSLAVGSVLQGLVLYGLVSVVLMAMFRLQYGRPFWHSLGWTPIPIPWMACVVCGFATMFAVGIAGLLIRTPPTSGPIIEMMKDRASLRVMAIFGTTAAPVFEELAFRGFLQPRLVRDLGPFAGIALAAALFGALHFTEYGAVWQSAVLVGLAGAAFGCMRHWTGSTAAAAIMHAAFNGLQFAGILFLGNSAR